MKLKSTLVISALATAVLSHAVIATTSTTATGPEDFTWVYVGRVGSASGVAVGPHSVLTVQHISATDFVLGGVTYHKTGAVDAPNLNGTHTDLRMITVAETLPGWYELGQSPVAGSGVTMVGYGATGKVAASGDYYTDITGMGTRRAGDNKIDGTVKIDGWGVANYAYLHSVGEASLAAGDSGGGWFDSTGRLIGINSFIFNDTDWTGGTPTPPDKLNDFGFASFNKNGWTWSGEYGGQHYDIDIAPGTAYFGSGAIDVTNDEVRRWAFQNGAVPEPASLSVLGLGALALMRRRKS